MSVPLVAAAPAMGARPPSRRGHLRAAGTPGAHRPAIQGDVRPAATARPGPTPTAFPIAPSPRRRLASRNLTGTAGAARGCASPDAEPATPLAGCSRGRRRAAAGDPSCRRVTLPTQPSPGRPAACTRRGWCGRVAALAPGWRGQQAGSLRPGRRPALQEGAQQQHHGQQERTEEQVIADSGGSTWRTCASVTWAGSSTSPTPAVSASPAATTRLSRSYRTDRRPRRDPAGPARRPAGQAEHQGVLADQLAGGGREVDAQACREARHRAVERPLRQRQRSHRDQYQVGYAATGQPEPVQHT